MARRTRKPSRPKAPPARVTAFRKAWRGVGDQGGTAEEMRERAARVLAIHLGRHWGCPWQEHVGSFRKVMGIYGGTLAGRAAIELLAGPREPHGRPVSNPPGYFRTTCARLEEVDPELARRSRAALVGRGETAPLPFDGGEG